MFKEFDPLNEKVFRIMDNDGKIINKKWITEIDDKELIKTYRFMRFLRIADEMTVSYQRQGRMYTYPPNFGQEAISAAAGLVMRKKDWLVPAFRELGAWLSKGAKLSDVFLYFGGREEGNLFSGAQNFLPSSVPVGSQLLHATGIGYALNLKKEKSIVYVFIGDGGTSEGDFHEALNFGGLWKVPVIYIVQNNQYAISVPVEKQTASKSIAIKSIAYGIKGIKVDGNDLLAMYSALRHSTDLILSGNGPILIEAETYRRGAHTTSDDPTLYRTSQEEEKWSKSDPIDRMKKFLSSKGLIDEKSEKKIDEQYKNEVEQQFSIYENYPAYKLEDVFKYNYEEIPSDLKKQNIEYTRFLKWKEARHANNEHGSGN